MSESTAKRFADLYTVEPDTGCFTWTGTLRSGRGRAPGRDVARLCPRRSGRGSRCTGPFTEGRWLKAVRGDAAWVNPDHLEPVVPAETVGGHRASPDQLPGRAPLQRREHLHHAEREADVRDLPALVTIP